MTVGGRMPAEPGACGRTDSGNRQLPIDLRFPRRKLSVPSSPAGRALGAIWKRVLVLSGFPDGSDFKECACNAEDQG